MKRIALFKDGLFSYSKPELHHFAEHDADIILTNILSTYYLDENNQIQWIGNHEFDTLSRKYNLPTISDLVCKHLNSLPDEVWDKLKQKYKFKQ